MQESCIHVYKFGSPAHIEKQVYSNLKKIESVKKLV